MENYDYLFATDKVVKGAKKAPTPTHDVKKKENIQGWINTNQIAMDQDSHDKDSTSSPGSGSGSTMRTRSDFGSKETLISDVASTDGSHKSKRRRTNTSSNGSQGKENKVSSVKTTPTQINAPTINKTKIAPINVKFDPTDADKKHNWASLYSAVRNACNFLPIFNSLSKNTCAIHPVNVADFRIIQATLSELKFEFFLYKTESPPVKYLIKGLHMFLDTSSIKQELTDQGFDIIAVNNLRSFKTKELTPKLIVTLESDTEKTRSILNLKTIFNIRINIEKFKKPPIATQCYNCQSFHHVAKLCHALPKCVKCGQNHNSSDCQRTANQDQPETEKEPIKCANCGGEHTANYRGCPVFKKLNDRIKSKLIANSRPKQSNIFKVLERDFPELKQSKNSHGNQKASFFENKNKPSKSSLSNLNLNATKSTSQQRREPAIKTIQKQSYATKTKRNNNETSSINSVKRNNLNINVQSNDADANLTAKIQNPRKQSKNPNDGNSSFENYTNKISSTVQDLLNQASDLISEVLECKMPTATLISRSNKIIQAMLKLAFEINSNNN